MLNKNQGWMKAAKAAATAAKGAGASSTFSLLLFRILIAHVLYLCILYFSVEKASVIAAADVIATHLSHNLKKNGGSYTRSDEVRDVMAAIKALGLQGAVARKIDSDASGTEILQLNSLL
jgi:hypothetical protein